MQKQGTGKAAWGHAMCYVMVKSVEGEVNPNPVTYHVFAKVLACTNLARFKLPINITGPF